MKFGSSITFLKRLIAKGAALSLICMPGMVEAVEYTVYNTNNAGLGSLRAGIDEVNASPNNNNRIMVNASGTLTLLTELPTLTKGVFIDASPTMLIRSPGSTWASQLLTIVTPTDAFVSAAVYNFGPEDTANWFGSFATNSKLILYMSGVNTTYGGNITGSGSVHLQRFGDVLPLTLTLSGASTYTGTTQIGNNLQDALTVVVNSNNALPITTPLIISGGSTFTIPNGVSQTLGGLVGAGIVNVNGTLRLNPINNNYTFSGIATGGSGFVKAGAGTQALSGQNMATTPLQINEGAIIIPEGGRWNGPVQIANQGGAPSLLVMNGGTVTGPITGDGTTNSNLNITGDFTPMAPITNVGAINVTTGGNFAISLNREPTGFLVFAVHNGGTVDLNTALTIPANATLTNAGTLLMNGNNLLMGTGSIFNSDSNLTTSGSIGRAAGATGYTLAVRKGSTLTVNNPITGYNNPLNVIEGSTVVLNNGGILSNNIALNNGTFTINGGTFGGNITTAGAPSTLNINNAFTPPGVVNVNTLNVNNGATFTPNATVTTNTALNINSGGTLLLTNNFLGLGTVVNAGTLTHTENVTRTIEGGFTQQATGVMNVSITNPQQYSAFQVNGHATLNGGIMNVEAPSDPTVIDGGEVFNIITSTGGITNNKLPTVPRLSLRFGFRPVVNGNTLQLIADRASYTNLNDIPTLDGIASALDSLVTNDNFNPLLRYADRITSEDEFKTLLEQIAPTGLNRGAYIAPGTIAEDHVLTRLSAIREMGTGWALAKTGYTRTGYAAGDVLEDQGAFGPMLFGNSTKQSARGGLPGYNALTAGMGILWDLPILQYFRVGLGASYASSAVKQSNNTGSNTTIGNTQGLVYGSASYGPLFLDGVLSVGINNYHGKRNIALFGKTATSAYTGSQYGAKVKTGFTVPCYLLEISPMAAVQYMHLNVGKYTEQGATYMNQSVDATQFSTVRLSLGGRIADSSQEGDFFPEIHAFYLVDVRNPNVQVTARFVEGGSSFVSTGVLPPKAGINVGASITALVSDNFVVSGGYDLEAKKTFKSHSASLKFKYLF